MSIEEVGRREQERKIQLIGTISCKGSQSRGSLEVGRDRLSASPTFISISYPPSPAILIV